MEHSCLLKFFTERSTSTMAETPTYKIELDFPSTSVNAEVLTEQKIRQYDTTKETITTENESVTTEKTTIRTESDNTVTEQEFLSPPIFTVTEKQSTFTKGDMTFQKVTVTEDVSKTNGHKFIRTESQMSVENSRMYFDGNEPGTPRNSESSITYETTEYDSRTEKEGKEKRSKIPMFRLKQAVEMVQNDQRDKKTRNKLKNAPRRSSIPKLKDTKMAIKVEPPAKPKLEDEFDKIYDEIFDNNTKDIDNKILTVKIEDPAKIESKFEEIIHAYDENAPETQSVNKEVLRLSKIPALRKKDDDRTSKLGAIVNRVKSKDNVTETKLKDGGFKISSSKIITKRFSREDSKEFKRELSFNEVENKEQISTDKNVSKMPIKTTPTKPERRSIKKDVLKDGHKVDVTETYEEIEDGTKRTIKRTVITENVEVNIPVNTEKVYHSLSREQSKDAPTIEIFKSVKDSPANRIIKETTIKSTGIPIKSSKIKSTNDKKYVDEKADIVKLGEKISREKYAINTTANNGSSETVDIEEYTDENGQKVIKKTIVKEQITIGAPIITERVISEVKSTRTENGNIEIGSNNAESEMVEIEEIIEEEIYSDNSKEFNSITDDINRDHTNIRSQAKIVKPVLTKASNNNSKGQINNVEVNKSIEWKQGNKVQSKTFSRSQSENVTRKVNGNGTLRKSISKIETKYTDDECKSKKNTGIQDDKPEIIIDRNARYEENKSNSVVVETKPTELNSKEHTFNKQFSVRDSEINFRNKEENVDVTDPTENSKPTSTKLIKVTKERDQNTNSSVIDEEEDITQIKGNVSRLINKFVNKESNNSPKDEGAPKKKTLLSKIAIFERVEPLEIPLKNNITERKTTKSISKEITIDQETKGKEIETESQTTGNINENITIDNNDADQGHSDTPIIVKEIWKFNGAASPLVTSPVIRENSEEVVALEANINENSYNKTTGDNKDGQVEYRKQYPIKMTPNLNRESIEMPTILPGKMYINKDENTHEAKTLPGNFNFKEDKERTKPTVLSPTNKKTEFSNDKFKLPKTPPNSAYIKSDEFVFEVPKILAENNNPVNTDCSETASKTNILPRDNGLADNTLNSVSTSQDNSHIKTIYKVEEVLYPEQITNENITEVKKSKPGKIDFSAWQKQIESNKIRVVKTEAELKDIPEKVKPSEKRNEGLPGSLNFETNKSKSPAVDKYHTKTDSDAEEPRKELSNQFANKEKAEQSPLKKCTIQTWEKVKIDKEEYKIHHKKTDSDGILVESVQAIHHNSVNKEINIDSDLSNKNVNQLTLTSYVPEKIDSEYSDAQTNRDKTDQNKNLDIQQVEAINLLHGKIEQAVNVGVLDKHKMLPGLDNKNIETPKRLPGKLNLDAWQNKVELNREKISSSDSKDNEILELNTLSGKRFTPHKTETEVVPTLPQKLSTYENKSVDDKIVQNNIEVSTPDLKEQVAKTEVEVTKVDTNLSDSNETLGDPELIDEENVVIQNNLTVVGKIKPMVYYIAANKLRGNTNITNENNQLNEIKPDNVELKENKVEQEAAEENNEGLNTVETELIARENRSQNGFDLQNESNETYDNDSSEYTKDKVLNTRLHKAQSSVTLDKTADEFENRENVQRAKSLAELDLGDVVKGKVQKMVVRMSSLDFEKQMDWEPKRKISIKEMPKKLSVLEKIALFEGKVTPAITNPPRNKPLQLNTPPIIPEEVYLQKIEELQTAKLKFGKFEDMLYWKMDNGDEIPVLAIGTAMLDKRLIQPIVSAAIDMGYRAIDTAFIYGNEKEVGQAIRDKIKEGVVRREDLFIMSKLWSTFHRPDLVEKACRQSLEAMGLEYFDLYMIHNPMSFKEGGDPLPKIANILQYSDFDYLDAWYGMEDLVHKGLVKAIGVSNFNSQQLQRILNKGKIKPVVNQVECHPYLTQQRLRDFCSSKNIILSCFGTLGSKGTPAELTSGVAVVTDDPLVQVMASGLGVSPAQMLIRYQIDNGNQVVVKASTAAHLWDNLQALMFTLDNAHVDALDALNRNKRIFTFKGMGDTHKNYPFKTAF